MTASQLRLLLFIIIRAAKGGPLRDGETIVSRLVTQETPEALDTDMGALIGAGLIRCHNDFILPRCSLTLYPAAFQESR